MALKDSPSEQPPSTRAWDAALAAGHGFRLRYVPTLDMVAITLGDARPAYSIEGEDGVIARVELATNEVIGLEIYDCRRRFLPRQPEFELLYLYARSRWFRLVADVAARLARHRARRAAIAMATARAIGPTLHAAVA